LTRTLVDYLQLRAPLLLLVEPDLQWGRTLIQDAVSTLSHGRLLPVLEWNAARGWSGPEHLVRASGLPQISASKRREADPIEHIQALLTWFSSLGDQKRLGRTPLLEGGLVVVHDLASYLDSPALSSVLLDLYDAARVIETSVIVLLPQPLAARHPLRETLLQVRLPRQPVARYGAMARDLAGRYSRAGDPLDEMEARVAAALVGVPVSGMGVVAGLVGAAREAGSTVPLPDLVAGIAQEIRPD
jgi:hypothetical protein